MQSKIQMLINIVVVILFGSALLSCVQGNDTRNAMSVKVDIPVQLVALQKGNLFSNEYISSMIQLDQKELQTMLVSNAHKNVAIADILSRFTTRKSLEYTQWLTIFSELHTIPLKMEATVTRKIAEALLQQGAVVTYKNRTYIDTNVIIENSQQYKPVHGTELTDVIVQWSIKNSLEKKLLEHLALIIDYNQNNTQNTVDSSIASMIRDSFARFQVKAEYDPEHFIVKKILVEQEKDKDNKDIFFVYMTEILENDNDVTGIFNVRPKPVMLTIIDEYADTLLVDKNSFNNVDMPLIVVSQRNIIKNSTVNSIKAEIQ